MMMRRSIAVTSVLWLVVITTTEAAWWSSDNEDTERLQEKQRYELKIMLRIKELENDTAKSVSNTAEAKARAVEIRSQGNIKQKELENEGMIKLQELKNQGIREEQERKNQGMIKQQELINEAHKIDAEWKKYVITAICGCFCSYLLYKGVIHWLNVNRANNGNRQGHVHNQTDSTTNPETTGQNCSPNDSNDLNDRSNMTSDGQKTGKSQIVNQNPDKAPIKKDTTTLSHSEEQDEPNSTTTESDSPNDDSSSKKARQRKLVKFVDTDSTSDS